MAENLGTMSGREGRGISLLPIRDYTGRLSPKGMSFKLEVYDRVDFTASNYFEELSNPRAPFPMERI